MSRWFILIGFLAGCAYGFEDVEQNPADGTVSIQNGTSTHQEAPVEPTYLTPDSGRDPDACVRQRFAADSIPAGFKFDINCPPDIYWPPRYIPPWDPGPIIR